MSSHWLAMCRRSSFVTRKILLTLWIAKALLWQRHHLRGGCRSTEASSTFAQHQEHRHETFTLYLHCCSPRHRHTGRLRGSPPGCRTRLWQQLCHAPRRDLRGAHLRHTRSGLCMAAPQPLWLGLAPLKPRLASRLAVGTLHIAAVKGTVTAAVIAFAAGPAAASSRCGQSLASTPAIGRSRLSGSLHVQTS